MRALFVWEKRLLGDCTVYIVGTSAKIQQCLQKLRLLAPILPEHLLSDRTTALQQAVGVVENKEKEVALSEVPV